MQTESTSIDLLEVEQTYVRATPLKRFLNYLIDVITFYVFIVLISFAIEIVSPAALAGLNNDSIGFGLADRLISLVLYGIYMSLVEAAFKGKSFGKLVTGTRAVNLDGTTISTATAFARGFSRAVPFAVLSAFGNPCDPWQDEWTDTMVVDERASRN